MVKPKFVDWFEEIVVDPEKFVFNLVVGWLWLDSIFYSSVKKLEVDAETFMFEKISVWLGKKTLKLLFDFG